MASLTKHLLLLAVELGDNVSEWVTVVIKDPKTQRSFGWTQHVLIKDGALMRSLARFFKGCASDTLLFAGSQDLLGKLF